MERPGALGVLRIEENEAWASYLETTQGAGPARYEEVEPWAWNRLGARLKAIHARRCALESPVRRTNADEGAPTGSPADGPEDDGA